MCRSSRKNERGYPPPSLVLYNNTPLSPLPWVYKPEVPFKPLNLCGMSIFGLWERICIEERMEPILFSTRSWSNPDPIRPTDLSSSNFIYKSRTNTPVSYHIPFQTMKLSFSYMCLVRIGLCLVRIGLCLVRIRLCLVRIGLCLVRIGLCLVRIGLCLVGIGLCLVRIGFCLVRIGLCLVRIG